MLSLVLAVTGFSVLIASMILVGAVGFIAGVGGVMLALGLVGVDLDDQERRRPIR